MSCDCNCCNCDCKKSTFSSFLEQPEKLTLRDKFAIEIFQSIIQADFASNTTAPLVTKFAALDADSHSEDKNYFTHRMERLIRTSYKIADMMRKVRFSTFE